MFVLLNQIGMEWMDNCVSDLIGINISVTMAINMITRAGHVH